MEADKLFFKYGFLNDIETSAIDDFLLSADENLKNRINRYKKQDNFKRSALGYYLVTKAYEEFIGSSAPPILFSGNGKPYFEGNKIHFSISHSNNLVVCVLKENEVGIDAEKIKKFNPKLIDRICTDAEKQYIGNSSERFFEIWTAKEAYSKLTGRGLAIGLKNIAVDIESLNIQGKKLTIKTVKDYIISIVSD